MSLEFIEDIMAKRNNYHYCKISKTLITSFKIYEVFCWNREVKRMEDKISKGRKDG